MTDPADWEELDDDRLLAAAEELITRDGSHPRVLALIDAILGVTEDDVDDGGDGDGTDHEDDDTADAERPAPVAPPPPERERGTGD